MFKLPDLEYGYDALEPHIDAQTMEIHHTKHHATYVEKLNTALEGHSDLQNLSIEDLLGSINSVPEDIRQAVINHGGGHANHSLFWNILSKDGGDPDGELLEAINNNFGSLEEFKKQFSEKALSVFGSGWVFLIITPEKSLKIKRQSFQNSPLMDGNTPILALDVWEHAYYLKYQNRRVEYVEAFWNIVNWSRVKELFLSA